MKEKQYFGYTVYENGDIVNRNGIEIKKRERNGKYEIKLTLNGNSRYTMAHRLMYFLFVKEFDIENRDLCITAKDGNFLNLAPSNLELKNRKDLIQGENQKNSKLTNAQIEEIREKYKGSCVNQYDKSEKGQYSYRDLAKQYGVTYGQIAQIIRKDCRDKTKYVLK